jgi:hypothetical protein
MREGNKIHKGQQNWKSFYVNKRYTNLSLTVKVLALILSSFERNVTHVSVRHNVTYLGVIIDGLWIDG